MSARKFIRQQVATSWPTPTATQSIARVLGPRGRNLHAIQCVNGDEILCSMPQRFRRNVWMKRGDYIIIEPIEEGDKVQAELTCVLLKDQIRYLKQISKWPAEFEHDVNLDKEIASKCNDDDGPSDNDDKYDGDDNDDDGKQVRHGVDDDDNHGTQDHIGGTAERELPSLGESSLSSLVINDKCSNDNDKCSNDDNNDALNDNDVITHNDTTNTNNDTNTDTGHGNEADDDNGYGNDNGDDQDVDQFGSESDDESDLMVNQNRRVDDYLESSSDEDEED
eukprot:m.86103 g.86103  ORF g.86103 m.86103 type:complete len:279 (+) comp25927_c1_seq3:384-1220(+)